MSRSAPVASSVLQAVVVASLLLLTASCKAPSDAERCADIEERLSAELQSLPSACREAADCHPVRIHCASAWALGTEVPISVTRLSKQFEDLDCCGTEAIWEGTIPDELPATVCLPGAEEAPDQCQVAEQAKCAAGCNALKNCLDLDPEGWSEHELGCEAGCDERLAEHPARTQRLIDCVVLQECDPQNACG